MLYHSQETIVILVSHFEKEKNYEGGKQTRPLVRLQSRITDFDAKRYHETENETNPKIYFLHSRRIACETS